MDGARALLANGRRKLIALRATEQNSAQICTQGKQTIIRLTTCDQCPLVGSASGQFFFKQTGATTFAHGFLSLEGHSPVKKVAKEKLELGASPKCSNVCAWRMNFWGDVARESSKPSGVMACINDVDSVRSNGDLKTSKSITVQSSGDFDCDDGNIASGLKKIINGDFQSKSPHKAENKGGGPGLRPLASLQTQNGPLSGLLSRRFGSSKCRRGTSISSPCSWFGSFLGRDEKHECLNNEKSL